MKRIRYIVPILILALILFFTPANLSEALAASGPQGPVSSSANEMVNVLIGFHRLPNRELVEQFRGEVYREFSIVNVIAARMAPQAAEALARHPQVNYVEPDGPVFAEGQVVPWGIDRVFGEEEYYFSSWGDSNGSGIGVAILDTGIDEHHEDLSGLSGGTNTIDNTHWGKDGHGHGTHVAGTIAALDNEKGVVGVSPGVNLYAVKVLSDSGSGTVSSVVAGIEWASKNKGIQVVNMSLGTGTHSQSLEDACNAAYGLGQILVSSAGNSGNSSGRGDTVTYPAKYKSVIAVAASTDSDRRASFSSTGPDVELIAPGAGILSTIPGNAYGTKSGTSMASPHVAGAVALLWAAATGLTNQDIRTILQETAEDLGLSANHQGYGLVRADQAVAAVRGTGIARVTIQPPSQESMALPGEEASYEFTVENTGDIEDTYNISTKSGWGSSVNPTSITLQPGGTATIELVHSVSDDALPGSFDQGTIEVFSTENEASASASFITTARGYSIEISPSLQSGAGTPGGTVEYTYTIYNTGTEDDSYTFTATSEWAASVSVDTVEVKSGGSANVILSHTIPEAAGEGSSNTGVLTAASKGDSSVFATAQFSTTAQKDEEGVLSILKFELTNTSNPAWARVRVEWTVSSSNGTLANVKSEMFLDGEKIDSTDSPIGGYEAGGAHELRNRRGQGKTYDITLTVTDTLGNKDTETRQIDL